MSERDEISLSDIPGLGPVRRAALEAAGVRDLRSLLLLNLAELAAIRGMGAWQARKIREFLRQRGLLLEGEEPESEGAAAPAVVILMEIEAAGEGGGEGGGAEVSNGAGPEESTERAGALSVEEAVLFEQRTEGPLPDGITGSDTQEERGSGGEAPPDGGTGKEGGGWREKVSEQREQLPETALMLIEAIRQAAVTSPLTRQITRLLIIAGELSAESRPLSDEQRRRGSEVLGRAEQALRQAVEKRSFSQGAQQELAKRLRRRRKELEQLLERG
jgi:hypothetical protein